MEVFYNVKHKYIYEAMLTLLRENIEPDLITICEQLKKIGTYEKAGGFQYLSEIQLKIPTYTDLQKHLSLLLEYHIRRSLIQISVKIINESFIDDVEALDLLLKTQNDLQSFLRAISTSNEITGTK